MSIGGGSGKGEVQNNPTMLGTTLGQQNAGGQGGIQDLFQQYMQNQQGQTTANNTLYGGQGYDPNGKFNQPTGGLVGYEKGQQTNPWITGAPGSGIGNESDVMGSYDWMSSGQRTNPENQVYGGEGALAQGPFGAGGVQDPNNPGQTLQGEGSQFNQGLMQGDQSALEKGATGGFQNLAAGPNAQESSLYGQTGASGGPTGQQNELYQQQKAFGDTEGGDVLGAEKVYQQETGPNAGYDEATKGAMTRESMNAARSPFEQARDRILRGAAARGNVGSTQGAEIQLANQESGALGNTAAKNQIAQAQEAIRQREAGAQGLQGTQGILNQQQESALAGQQGQQAQLAAQRQTAIQQQAGQNAQLASQKLAGSQGVAQMGAAQRGQQALGAQNQANLAAAGTAQKEAALGAENAQNQALRATQATGAAGKENMFQQAAGREQAGTQGLQGLYNTGQQVGAGERAGASNLGTQKVEDYTQFGNASGSL
jgi:hypothetical protein